ncbi:hypothetical protein CCB81_03390 [Armatimonadetes bacterium Uphvl-Ar2]|nr:hypothetical protein CCB81_03390 [Armatimonadetes bacterium Uphvl-Ar2]
MTDTDDGVRLRRNRHPLVSEPENLVPEVEHVVPVAVAEIGNGPIALSSREHIEQVIGSHVIGRNALNHDRSLQDRREVGGNGRATGLRRGRARTQDPHAAFVLDRIGTRRFRDVLDRLFGRRVLEGQGDSSVGIRRANDEVHSGLLTQGADRRLQGCILENDVHLTGELTLGEK